MCCSKLLSSVDGGDDQRVDVGQHAEDGVADGEQQRRHGPLDAGALHGGQRGEQRHEQRAAGAERSASAGLATKREQRNAQRAAELVPGQAWLCQRHLAENSRPELAEGFSRRTSGQRSP